MKVVEYRVRPVTRWVVTRFVSDENGVSCGPIAEFDNEHHADLVVTGMRVFQTTRECEIMEQLEKDLLAKRLGEST